MRIEAKLPLSHATEHPAEGHDVREPFPNNPSRVSCPGCRHVVLFPPLDRTWPPGTTMATDCPQCGAKVVFGVPIVAPPSRGRQLAVLIVAIGVVVAFVVWIIRVLG